MKTVSSSMLAVYNLSTAISYSDFREITMRSQGPFDQSLFSHGFIRPRKLYVRAFYVMHIVKRFKPLSHSRSRKTPESTWVCRGTLVRG